MKDFIQLVVSKRDGFINKILTYSDVNKIQEIVMKSLNLKNIKDLNDRYEGLDFYKKFSLKLFGVIAIEKILKIKLINWETINPRDYNAIIDIDGKKIRVITSEYGEFPMINKEYKRAIIFCFKRDKKDIWVCGLADKEILEKHQSDKFLKGAMTRNMDSKTTFIGFDKLKSFNSIDELRNILK